MVRPHMHVEQSSHVEHVAVVEEHLGIVARDSEILLILVKSRQHNGDVRLINAQYFCGAHWGQLSLLYDPSPQAFPQGCPTFRR